jgi:hypothetical protein
MQLQTLDIVAAEDNKKGQVGYTGNSHRDDDLQMN